MNDLTPLRMDRYSGPERCGTAAHRGAKRPPAVYLVHKPRLTPPLPGPELNYLCSNCMTRFIMATAVGADELPAEESELVRLIREMGGHG